jgi:hypothetical protein
MKKIYRVYAHDVETGFKYNSFYATEQSTREFTAQLIEDHDGTIVIDEIVEYSVEATVDLLNLYKE